MVGPGEVDDDLEPETAEECSKYGKVMKCVIFEVRRLKNSCFLISVLLFLDIFAEGERIYTSEVVDD